MLALALAAGFAAAPQLSYYNNSRYAYSLCYPSLLRANREADNGDGRSFTGPGGGKMAVWGSNDINGTSLASHMASYGERGDIVTYAARKSNWIVQSGRRGNAIFWRKAFKGNDRFVTLEITYPATAQGTYGPVVSRVSSCFRA